MELSTEDKILLAAENEFLNKGFSAARTTAIAEAAGVTHAMLHYYYRSKEKLFDKILESKVVMIRDMIIGSINVPDSPLFQKIEMAISSHFDFLMKNPLLPHFFINEIYTEPERFKHITEWIKSNVANVAAMLQMQIDEQAAKGLCKKYDANSLLINILSLNAFPFVAEPLVKIFAAITPNDYKAFLEKRKQNNIDIILGLLKP